jgi:ABC-type amino acid transport system permease subunit
MKMFDKILKSMSLEAQGVFSLILGLILVLGTLGKLQILQGILNSVMIFTGIILLIWGLNASKGINKIKGLLHKK